MKKQTRTLVRFMNFNLKMISQWGTRWGRLSDTAGSQAFEKAEKMIKGNAHALHWQAGELAEPLHLFLVEGNDSGIKHQDPLVLLEH